jgi:hypothetical protein
MLQIRQVLINDWDPIGIHNEPNALDEYDGYISEIYRRLVDGESVAELQAYLFSVVSDRMGMSAPATLEDMSPAAEALKRIGILV